jgi:hypothetical protein
MELRGIFGPSKGEASGVQTVLHSKEVCKLPPSRNATRVISARREMCGAVYMDRRYEKLQIQFRRED